ncbi:helix-turn-helix domain-containing protein [Kribbella sp. NPDC059898]|uniref:helix-turn-helix domain-containing protein n=1 Tax=Kribbella sp. NPDC059898 TaxID=3346995 RepID=UPI00365357C0
MAEHPLAKAIMPLVERLNAELVAPADARGDDIPLEWEGEAVVAVRLPQALGSSVGPGATARAGGAEGAGASAGSGGVQGLLADVAVELGGPLNELSRTGKQQAVLLLESRGAFEYRKSAEIVAEALGVTRFTVYNYLNRSR